MTHEISQKTVIKSLVCCQDKTKKTKTTPLERKFVAYSNQKRHGPGQLHKERIVFWRLLRSFFPSAWPGLIGI